MLHENWSALQVFQMCLPTFAGMGAVAGIAASEIHAAVRLLRLPPGCWREVAHKVHYMGCRLVQEQSSNRMAPAR